MKVQYSNAQSREEAYQLAKGAITPELIERFKVNANISYKDDDHTILADGKGFNLKILFLDNECDIDLKLSLLLRPLKGKVEETIEKQVKRIV